MGLQQNNSMNLDELLIFLCPHLLYEDNIRWQERPPETLSFNGSRHGYLSNVDSFIDCNTQKQHGPFQKTAGLWFQSDFESWF